MKQSAKIALVRHARPDDRHFPRSLVAADAYLGALAYLRGHSDWHVVALGLPLTSAQTLLHVSDIRRGEIAGVIVFGRQQIVVERCQEQGIPVVGMNRFAGSVKIPTVFHDDVAIGRLAALHFLRRGIRSLAFCGPDYVSVRNEPLDLRVGTLTPWVQLRLQGFAEEAKVSKASCSVFYNPETATHEGEPDDACTRRFLRDLRRWVRGLPRPTGILACADTFAMDCLAACEKEELRVPQDMAVLGVDNDAFRCEASRPSLSSVDRNMHRVGYEASALLVRFLKTGQWGKVPIVVPPAGVVERHSTQALAVANPKLAKALRFVRDRFCDPISVRDVARAAGVSESSLRRGFQQELHFSLVGEIRRLRVEKACELLTSTNLPLKMVAEAAGFHSETYLCDTFAKDLGVSPGAWRGSR